jgi:DNA-directed RNA polymerase subunit RPC12/RpoP
MNKTYWSLIPATLDDAIMLHEINGDYECAECGARLTRDEYAGSATMCKRCGDAVKADEITLESMAGMEFGGVILMWED